MDYALLSLSLIAGILTIFAPCVFTLLPVILGSSADGQNKYKPYIVTASLVVSIFIFTLLLRASTLLIDIPEEFWNIFSGTILVIFGIFTIIPEWWDRLSFKLGLSTKTNQNLNSASQKEGIYGDILIGAALGPVFTSCSPTYFVILGIAANDSILNGIFYLISYSLGLGFMLLLINLGGQSMVKKLNWAADPHGIFKRFIGIIFLIVGWSILFGLHKEIQTFIIEEVPFLNATSLENDLLEKIN